MTVSFCAECGAPDPDAFCGECGARSETAAEQASGAPAAPAASTQPDTQVAAVATPGSGDEHTIVGSVAAAGSQHARQGWETVARPSPAPFASAPAGQVAPMPFAPSYGPPLTQPGPSQPTKRGWVPLVAAAVVGVSIGAGSIWWVANGRTAPVEEPAIVAGATVEPGVPVPSATPTADPAPAPAAEPEPTPTTVPQPVETPTVQPIPTAEPSVDEEAAALARLQELRSEHVLDLPDDRIWVPMLSSKFDGARDDYQVARNGTHTFRYADILAQYEELVASHGPAVRVVSSEDVYRETRPDLWVVFYDGHPFDSAQEAARWCASTYPRLSGAELENQCAARQVRRL